MPTYFGSRSEDEQMAMMTELLNKTWDAKFLNTRTNKVLRKHARENLIFQRGVSQTAIYEEYKGTIENIDEMPHLASADSKVREISRRIAESGTQTEDCALICEGNKYRTKARIKAEQQGIGYHGDKERTRVFALSVGGYNYPMQWVLFHRSCPRAPPEKVYLNSGDLYIMTELAVMINLPLWIGLKSNCLFLYFTKSTTRSTDIAETFR